MKIAPKIKMDTFIGISLDEAVIFDEKTECI
jgi:hypothetical protein